MNAWKKQRSFLSQRFHSINQPLAKIITNSEEEKVLFCVLHLNDFTLPLFLKLK